MYMKMESDYESVREELDSGKEEESVNAVAAVNDNSAIARVHTTEKPAIAGVCSGCEIVNEDIG
jgi:hypothetical protein